METHPNLMQYLQDTLNVELGQVFTGNAAHLCGKFALFIKRKPNEQGDCHFPAFGRRVESLKEFYKDTEVDVLQEFQKIFTSSSLLMYIKEFNISSSTGQLNLRLNRLVVTQVVINNVIHAGSEYGSQKDKSTVKGYGALEDVKEHGSCYENTKVFVLNNGFTEKDDGEISLEYLRTVITLAYMKKIFLANGLQTQVLNARSMLDYSLPKLQAMSNLLSMFDESYTKTKSLDAQLVNYKRTVEEVQEMLAKCSNVSSYNDRSFNEDKIVDVTETEANICEKSFKDGNTASKVDSQAYYLDCEKLSKSYGLQKVDINDAVIQKVSSLEFNARNLPVKPGDSHQLLHITSCNQLHKCKQDSVVWKEVSSNPLAKNQGFMSLGVITVLHNGQRLKNRVGVQELLRIRKEQLRSAYSLKYGDIVKGPGWEQSINAMAVANIKLQIMAAAQNNQIKLDISDSAQDFRQATFIMYNCARLSKLFEHYQQSVEKGLYPTLPKIEKIDFSLLRDKDEWTLLLRYIMAFPSIIRESGQGLLTKPNHSGLITININRISCFLQGLSYDFSSYYRRVHILGEARSHLFPTMFARIYLLKAIQQVFHNCLALLDILPLTQM